VLKFQKYLNNPRNIQTEISNKKNFIDLNDFLNKKIIDTLFDYTLISNSILNEDKKDKLLLEEEQNIIDEIINKFETKNINKNINGVKQNEKDFYENEINNDNYLIINNNKYINSYISTVSNSTSKSNSIISSTNNSCQSSTHKKNINIFSEDDEKSLILLTKDAKHEYEQINNENKIYIKRMNNIKIYNFLNSIDEKDNYNLKIKISKKQVIQKFEEVIKDEIDEYDKLNVINNYLRKNACLKLYKVFSFIFKKYKIKESKIKNFCKYIEYKARKKDYNMGTKYKQFIINFLKKIGTYN